MFTKNATVTEFFEQARLALVIAKKDAVIYYLKPPVISFGIIYPLFFYLAFAAGRNVAATSMVPGIVAMALFFTASAVGPLVTPWERQARTYERLVTSPASIWAILLGDVGAGAAFGAVLAFLPVVLGCALTDGVVHEPLSLLAGLGFGAVAFSALGVLMAARATDTPSEVMMLSNLVRLPLIFISGVFIPLHDMPTWGQRLAPLSPLSYSVDLIRMSFGGLAYFSFTTDIMALVLFASGFLALAHALHRRSQTKAR